MKLACAVSTYPTSFGPIVFKDGNLKENFDLMKKYGYQGMDLFIKKTSREQLLEYKKLIKDYGMDVVTLFAIYLGESGVKLSEKDPALRRRNVDLMKEQLDNAKELDSVGLGLGYIRGAHSEDETEADAKKRIAEALYEIGDYAAQIGSTILLEPINRYEINTINKATDAVDFIKENNLKGVTLQLDMFHMNIEDKSIPYAIEYAKGLISNLHVSSSNRHAVGTGHFDFAEVTAALRKVGYDGFLTLEAFSTDADETLRMTAENLKKYL
ncbi:sugar phosphate isomerase/epimerase family protein [Candidatus Epulonipiscium viviparus]|uniref:sugar phosphate isomerase/epimerase family protein n=1 Tax=Candidatus Epulonipiscium viviparus TaxID=420336 RepID=UPI000497E0AC|nr:sugar phosphate isomerase/epimerase family protein [Candidatus Epulopiscium viviparus]